MLKEAQIWWRDHAISLIRIQSKHKKNGPDSVNNSLNSTINLLILAQCLMKNLLIPIIPIAYRPVSSADQQVIGVIRCEPPFISVLSSWTYDTSRRPDSDHWRPRVAPLIPAITAPHTNHLFFHKQHYYQLLQPLTNCTPVIGWGYKPWFGWGVMKV